MKGTLCHPCKRFELKSKYMELAMVWYDLEKCVSYINPWSHRPLFAMWRCPIMGGRGLDPPPVSSIIFISDGHSWYLCVGQHVLARNMSFKLISDSQYYHGNQLLRISQYLVAGIMLGTRANAQSSSVILDTRCCTYMLYNSYSKVAMTVPIDIWYMIYTVSHTLGGRGIKQISIHFLYIKKLIPPMAWLTVSISTTISVPIKCTFMCKLSQLHLRILICLCLM